MKLNFWRRVKRSWMDSHSRTLKLGNRKKPESSDKMGILNGTYVKHCIEFLYLEEKRLIKSIEFQSVGQNRQKSIPTGQNLKEGPVNVWGHDSSA